MNHARTRGWMIVGTTFMSLAVLYGAWYSYSVFLVALLREFGWKRSLVSGAFSIFVLVHGLCAPLAGWLMRVAGPTRPILVGALIMGGGLCLTAQTTEWWHLYLAFGGLAAIGMSLAGWIPAVVLIRGWFPDRVATMLGVASAGIGIGIFGLVPLAEFLIDRVGWRWAYRILAALIVAWVVPATIILVRDPPSVEATSAASGSRMDAPAGRARPHWTLSTAVRSWRYWGLAGNYFTGNFVTQMLMIHQVAYLVDHRVPALVAAAVSGATGLVSILAKIGWGWLSDRTNRELAYSLAFVCVAGSIGALVVAGMHPTPLLLHLYAVLIGVGYGVMAPVPPAVASDLFGGPGFSTIFGTLYVVTCLGLATGTWSAGEIFDRTGSYAAALWLGLAMTVLSPALLWVVAPRRPNPPPGKR
ncbi:MAG TPA: MFS transporter [Candidatus Methylomirabilis sp.]|nr:MFS transporter [Candidatus Methylomirabilis sp.]